MKPMVLLVGNGPSALAKPVGDLIDNFPGLVVRFNDFRLTAPSHVGRRTDVWSTCGPYPPAAGTYAHVLWVTFTGQDDEGMVGLRDSGHKVERIPDGTIAHARRVMEYDWPSSGALVAAYFIERGYEVWLWGFDFMQEGRPHHYADNVEHRSNHSPDHEWLYFQRLARNGDVRFLGHDPAAEGIPIIRQPSPCGTDDNLSVGRQPCQMGWYDFAVGRHSSPSVLDVGAGMGDGLRLMRERGATVARGWEVDTRLAGQDEDMVIGGSLASFGHASYDVVTCMDVIEHVVEDRNLLGHLLRIARSAVYVSTPNWTRSRARNGHHCREYTIAQFCNTFDPNELWVGSPDGWHHRTLLLRREGAQYVESLPGGGRHAHARGSVPLDYRFNRTVDGQEWPHFCGVFYPSKLG